MKRSVKIIAPKVHRAAVLRQASLIPLLCSLVFAACDRSEEAVETSAPTEPEPVVEEVVDPVVAEAEALANSLRSRQLTLAADLRAAVDAGDSAATGAAFAELGRSLAEMRGSTFEGPLVEAVRWFASAEMAELRATVDARRVIPALEVMLDVRDGAAVQRLQQSYSSGPGAERFQAAFSLSLSWSNAPSSVSFGDPGCPLLIDGEPAPESPAQLTFGSHTIGCEGGAVLLFVAHSVTHQVNLENGEFRVSP